jgi:hypothetical protein
MQLRYFNALDTDHLVLELGDAQFAINSWSKDAIDVIGALDAQEYDTTKFGSVKVSNFNSTFCLLFSLLFF